MDQIESKTLLFELNPFENNNGNEILGLKAYFFLGKYE